MQTFQLKPNQVKITKELKTSVRFAREHYQAWLKEKRRQEMVNERQESKKEDVRKRELQDLQKQRNKVKRRIASLDKKISLLSKKKKV